MVGRYCILEEHIAVFQNDNMSTSLDVIYSRRKLFCLVSAIIFFYLVCEAIGTAATLAYCASLG
jgi:hypothetical protein